jgi:hypothetical protein
MYKGIEARSLIFRFEILIFDLFALLIRKTMNQGKAVLSQLISFLPEYEFDKCVDAYNGNYRVRTFTCREHFYVMSFSQLTYRESLRDIEACLTALSSKLYHCGIKHPVSKSTLAEAVLQRFHETHARHRTHKRPQRPMVDRSAADRPAGGTDREFLALLRTV